MLLLEGGRVLCPLTGRDERADVLVKDGLIAAIGLGLDAAGATRLDCVGRVVAPAFVDLVAELADPGFTWREDLRTGSMAAAAGGFARVLASPATDPVVDTAPVAAELVARAAGLPGAAICVAGALTVGNRGEELAELNQLVEAGCCALSDGARGVADSLVLRNALEYARPLGRPVILRPADLALEERGVMHEGAVSTAIGLHGIPAESEEIGVARAIALARLTGARVHLSHVTTAGSLALLADARQRGLSVSATVPARQLLLTDEAVDTSGYNPDTRLLPPLRPEADRAALVAAVRAGEIGICSDHRPWSRVEKEVEFSQAEHGSTGLETAFSAAWTALAPDLGALVRALSCLPAAVLGRDALLAPGLPADLVVLDPEAEQRAATPRFSRGRNEALAGQRLRGLVCATLVGGRLAFQARAGDP